MTHLMKLTVLSVVLLGAATFASAETILINFGGIDSSPDAGGDGTLTHWNEAVKNGTQSTVVDSDGNTVAGVSVATADMGGTTFDNSGTYASGGSAASWVDLDAVELVWFNQGSGGSVTISGLTAPAYTVDLIAARSTEGTPANFDRINDYYANGSLSDGDESLDWSSYVDGWVAGGVLTWSSVNPDAGVITMTDGDNTNSHWTAMRLTAVPEPATMALLGLGGVVGLMRRRKA